MLKRSLVLIVGCLVVSFWVVAADKVSLSIAKWSFDELTANQLEVSFDITDDGIGFIALADTVQLNPKMGMLHAVKLVCSRIQLLPAQIGCKQGKISFRHNELGQQTVLFSIHAQPDKQHYRIQLDNIKLANGIFSGLLTVHQQHWKLDLATPGTALQEVRKLLEPYMKAQQKITFQDWEIDGKTAIELSLSGNNKGIRLADIKLDMSGLNISESSGKYVTEQLGFKLHLNAQHQSRHWQWRSRLYIKQGQAYIDPVYLDFSQTPISFQSQGSYQNDTSLYTVDSFMLKQGNTIEVTGNMKGNRAFIHALDITLKKTPVKPLYQIWGQPFVVGTVLDNLDLAGDIAVNLHLNDRQYTVTADLTQIYLHQASDLFSIDNLNGKLGWTNGASPVDFSLNWDGGYLYAIPVGKSAIDAQVSASALTLQRPWQLPVLDGRLDIQQFELHYDKTVPLQWHVAAQLSPISMEKLSTVLGWPLLHGKLSGTVPDVQYQAHQITVGGALKVNLFGGNTVIRDLKLERSFGVLPQLEANILLRDIDLKTLTQTFDFGEITGKLDGQINNLRLSNWKAVQFDATFSTPDNDTSRHRISQQAVNNLSEIGGGAAGALQRSFLRFFENFSYQKLGLSCKLRNEVCEMSGVGNAKQGYYIVKGGGFPPRIDVVGYTRRVNWPDLIARLQAVSHSSGPVIK